MFEIAYYSIYFWFYTSLIIKTFHPLLKILKSKYSLLFLTVLVHILLQCFITVNGSGRFTCVISLLVGMFGLVLQIPVMFPAVTYVKMHLVCRSLFYFLLYYWYFSEICPLCLVKEFQAYDSPFGDIYVAFFYCEVDGSSLCLQCDMIVHVGGKRTHGRYLLLRQRVEVCNFYTERLESQSSFCYVKFLLETFCLFCSFQGINLVILRSQLRNL